MALGFGRFRSSPEAAEEAAASRRQWTLMHSAKAKERRKAAKMAKQESQVMRAAPRAPKAKEEKVKAREVTRAALQASKDTAATATSGDTKLQTADRVAEEQAKTKEEKGRTLEEKEEEKANANAAMPFGAAAFDEPTVGVGSTPFSEAAPFGNETSFDSAATAGDGASGGTSGWAAFGTS